MLLHLCNFGPLYWLTELLNIEVFDDQPKKQQTEWNQTVLILSFHGKVLLNAIYKDMLHIHWFVSSCGFLLFSGLRVWI